MAIVIKEIQVRTMIERDRSPKGMDEATVAAIKTEIYRQLKEDINRDIRRKRER